MNIKPTTSLYLDTRREKSDKTYPVKLRLTLKGQRRYFSVPNVSLDESDFEKLTHKNLPREKTLKKTRSEVLEFKHEADEYIRNCKIFSFTSFNEEFIKKRLPGELPNDVFAFFEFYIEELNKESRLGTAESYFYALKSFKKFHKAKVLPFENIDQKFLSKYERTKLASGYSLATIGIYLRNLRAIINLGIVQGVTDNKPFGQGKFQIKNQPARKIALITEELKALFSYQPKELSSEHYFFDLWKFLYLCNGILIKDICYLKYSNIERDKIFILREKTIRTTLNRKEIVIPITDKIKQILKQWGQSKINKDTYVFPIIKAEMSEKERVARVKQTVKQVNKYIRRAAKNLNINVKISSGTARHSYATQLMRHGAPYMFISKQLGHSNIKTTNDYLENFEDRQLENWQKKLTEFELPEESSEK